MRTPTTSCEWLWKNVFLSDIDIKIVETSGRNSRCDRGDFVGSSDIFSPGAGRSVRIPGHALLLCQHSQVLRTLVEIQKQNDAVDGGNPDIEQSTAGLLRHLQQRPLPPPLQQARQKQRPCVALRVGCGLLSATLLMLEAMYDPLALAKTAAAAAAVQDTQEPSLQSSSPTSHLPLHAGAVGFPPPLVYSSDEDADLPSPFASLSDEEEMGPQGAYHAQHALPTSNRLLATASWFSTAAQDPPPGAGGSSHGLRRASMHGGPEDISNFNALSSSGGGAGGSNWAAEGSGGRGGASLAPHDASVGITAAAAALGPPPMARLPEESSEGLDAPHYSFHPQQEEEERGGPMALLLGVIWQADKFQADGVIKVRGKVVVVGLFVNAHFRTVVCACIQPVPTSTFIP